MIQRFTVNVQPTSEWGMNKVYAGKHWSVRKTQAHQMHLIVRAAIRQQIKKPMMYTQPVSVRIRYDSRLDIDNHGYLAKLIIDGMKGVLIEEDDRRYVKQLVQEFHSMGKDRIFVEVEEYENDKQ